MNFKPKDKVVFNKDLFRMDGPRTREVNMLDGTKRLLKESILYVSKGTLGEILEVFKNKIGGYEPFRYFAKVKTKDGIKTARIASINFAHEI